MVGFDLPKIILIVLASVSLFGSAFAQKGGWSSWSTIERPCNKTCGGGFRLRVRSCANPEPVDDSPGNQCTDDPPGSGIYDKEYIPCNEHDCNVEIKWSEWTPCSKSCVKGERERYLLCPTASNPNATCEGNQADTQYGSCNLWNVTKSICGDPCTWMPGVADCPLYSTCKDISSEFEAKAECVCFLGYEMNEERTACIQPPPPPPTPRPIPTLPPAEKKVAQIVSRSASTVLLIFVSLTLLLFIFMRIFTVDRVIQMNMEIALACAHILLLLPTEELLKSEVACRVISILLHWFFTACFAFMLLESVHMYSLVAFVVRKNGMFNSIQNVLIGWGLAAMVTVVTMCFCYEEYGAPYHCWLQMHKPIALGHLIPIVTLTILTLTLTEAAGNAEYKKLNGVDNEQFFSAKVSQRTNLFILAFVFASYIVGVLSDHEQNLALYGTFSSLNSVLGVLVFLGHTMGNQIVRARLRNAFSGICGGGNARHKKFRK